METVINIFFGLAILWLWAIGLYVLGWKWFLNPLRYAWRERQWVWVAVILTGAWIGGLVYLYRFVDDYVVPEPEQYANGDVIIWHGNAYRVLGHDVDSVRCLHLGERRVRAVPSAS